MNLNEDPLLSKKLIHNIKKKKIINIGRKVGDGEEQNDIVINGVGIRKYHARIEYLDDIIVLKCLNLEAGENIFING